MNRKDFIIDSCTACLSFTAISALLLTSCSPTKYIQGNLGKDGLTISTEEFESRKNGKIVYLPMIIIRNDALQYPICLYRISNNEFTALWMQCTHQGAELQASGDFLQCPAHGSEFNNKGSIMNGPADTNLRSFPVIVSRNELFIDLRKQS